MPGRHIPTNVRWIPADDLAAELLLNNPQAADGSAQIDGDILDLVQGGFMEAGRDLDTGFIVLRMTAKGHAFIQRED